MRGAFTNEPSYDFSIDENRSAMRAALQEVEGQLGRRYPIVIGGERRETGKWIKSINPGNLDQVVGEVAQAGPQDVDDAVKAATAAFQEWRKMPAEGRASVLFRMAGIIRRRKLELAAWIVYELDKAWDEAEGELSEAIDFLEWYGRQALALDRPVSLASLPDEAVELRWVPLGVGAVIPPWNFPAAILTGMTMAPVAAGDTVVLKPASNTPVIGYKLFEIMEEAGVPAGVVNFLPGPGSEVGDALVEHPGVRFVAFTGSKEVGVRINERAARLQPGQRWLKRVSAEMGGKDAIIVDADADLEAAAEGIVTSTFGFSGQKCSACSRAIVHQDVYDEIVRRVVQRARALVKVGPGTEGKATVGAVVDAKQYRSILDYIDIGKREGKLLLGGDKADGHGYYIEPTIFADVPETARIAREEIFGPVLSIIKADSFDDALRIANDTEYGLTGSVYSRNRAHLEQARRDFEVGTLYFNRKCTGALMGVHSFGGMKLSGTNTRGGAPDTLQHFMELKSIGERV